MKSQVSDHQSQDATTRISGIIHDIQISPVADFQFYVIHKRMVSLIVLTTQQNVKLFSAIMFALSCYVTNSLVFGISNSCIRKYFDIYNEWMLE
jgi:hypothetical protein